MCVADCHIAKTLLGGTPHSRKGPSHWTNSCHTGFKFDVRVRYFTHGMSFVSASIRCSANLAASPAAFSCSVASCAASRSAADASAAFCVSMSASRRVSCASAWPTLSCRQHASLSLLVGERPKEYSLFA